MSLAKNIVTALAPFVPVSLGHALARSPLILPYYHMVSDESLPHVAPLYRYRNVRQFTGDMDFFLKHFQPVGLSDLLAHVNDGTALPARAFLLTFDDGFREMAEIVAPILKAKGVSAAFFINPAFVDNRELCLHQKTALLIEQLMREPSPVLETKLKQLLMAKGIDGDAAIPMLRSVGYGRRPVLDEAAALCGLDFTAFLARQKPYLTSEQIRGLLRDGFAIGGHSVDHPFYGDLTLDEQLRQTRESVGYVHEKFGVKYRAFAFPHSDTGVSQAFFARSQAEGILDISFGTGGLLRDPWPNHFQRFNMEKSNHSPRQILTWQLARRCGRGAVQRATDSKPNGADASAEKQFSI